MGGQGERGVVITGASTGIGRACALDLATRGWRVFGGVRREADGQALAEASGGAVTPLRLEVTDPAQILAAAETVRAALGDVPLAGLVNNAGMAVAAPLEFVPIDELRRQLEVNVVAQVAVTQGFLPLLRRAPPGTARVVFTGSISGRSAAPFLGPYAASKYAIEAVTDSLRRELRPWRIHAAVVEPGVIATPIWQRSQDAAKALEARLPPAYAALYGQAAERLREAMAKVIDKATPPEAVARAVRHALEAARPRARYLVGLDARLQAKAVAVVPDLWMDGLVRKAMGLD